jgi:hypothetical protein
VLHPVGPLPAVVYWRRRALVLTLLLGVLGGGGWLGYAAATGRLDDGTTTAAATTSAPVAQPALERVVPSLAGVQVPALPPSTAAASSTAAAPPQACTDDMLELEVRTPGTAAEGTQASFDLVVRNVAPVACVRSLDQGLRELVLLDAAGNRVWGSHDCLPVTGSDLRTLAPGEAVGFPVEWSGLTSDPTCTAPRVPAPAGAYVVRGRLATKVAADAPFTVG